MNKRVPVLAYTGTGTTMLEFFMTLMSEKPPELTIQDENRKQLGAFLRARRESLDPKRLGLPRSGRRRTPGLRREEVAMLADVGVTWYTWLEQGRDVNPSATVLQAIAGALQCSATEARHLFLLAGLPPTESLNSTPCEGISEGTRRLLDSLLPQPASIQKPDFDIVAWNTAFERLMGVNFAAMAAEDRNCIYLYLTNPHWRSRLGQDDNVLETFVAYFRAAMAGHQGEPLWEAKLARFCAASPEFAAMWHQHLDVRGVENRLKIFAHPQLGQFTLQQMYWYSAPRNGSRLLVYVPVDEQGEQALQKLASNA